MIWGTTPHHRPIGGHQLCSQLLLLASCWDCWSSQVSVDRPPTSSILLRFLHAMPCRAAVCRQTPAETHPWSLWISQPMLLLPACLPVIIIGAEGICNWACLLLTTLHYTLGYNDVRRPVPSNSHASSVWASNNGPAHDEAERNMETNWVRTPAPWWLRRGPTHEKEARSSPREPEDEGSTQIMGRWMAKQR
jgi:hypothetical protein